MAESVKLGGGGVVTVSITVVFRCRPPPLPVTVIGYVPTGVPEPTMMLMVELPLPGADSGLGLKLTVVPDGAPVADNVIELLKPPLMVEAIVDVF